MLTGQQSFLQGIMPSTAASTQFLLDNLDGADSTTLIADGYTATSGTGHTWARPSAGDTAGADYTFTGGRVWVSTGSATDIVASIVPASADYTVEGSLYVKGLSTLSTNAIGIGCRASTTERTSYQLIFVSSASNSFAGSWRLRRLNAGAGTTLADSGAVTLTVTDTHALKLSCAGTTISAWVDGVLIGSVTDATISAVGRVAIVGGYVTSATAGNHLASIEAYY